MKSLLAELDFNQWSYTISAIRELSHNRDEFSKATQSLCWARTHKPGAGTGVKKSKL